MITHSRMRKSYEFRISSHQQNRKIFDSENERMKYIGFLFQEFGMEVVLTENFLLHAKEKLNFDSNIDILPENVSSLLELPFLYMDQMKLIVDTM